MPLGSYVATWVVAAGTVSELFSGRPLKPKTVDKAERL
jgi:hypothetical protein